MRVRRTLPQRHRSLIGAWCFVDHYGPDDVAETGGMVVPPHPHTGLQTVSWLFTGEVEHRDSAGHHAMVRPGEVNLMTAGRGISHSEVSPASTTTLHGAQLWVALPDSARHTDPGFAHHAPGPAALEHEQRPGVEEMKDLQPGMLLEGVVTNVANFGAFVDIGVHQDGLVHVSALADRFIKDPREVVKPGDIVKVKVLEVDLKRKRISLTMRLSDEAVKRPPRADDRPLTQRDRQHMAEKPKPAANRAPDNALAAAFSKAGFNVRK